MKPQSKLLRFMHYHFNSRDATQFAKEWDQMTAEVPTGPSVTLIIGSQYTKKSPRRIKRKR